MFSDLGRLQFTGAFISFQHIQLGFSGKEASGLKRALTKKDETTRHVVVVFSILSQIVSSLI